MSKKNWQWDRTILENNRKSQLNISGVVHKKQNENQYNMKIWQETITNKLT
jgi:hypothetical protein